MRKQIADSNGSAVQGVQAGDLERWGHACLCPDVVAWLHRKGVLGAMQAPGQLVMPCRQPAPAPPLQSAQPILDQLALLSLQCCLASQH